MLRYVSEPHASLRVCASLLDGVGESVSIWDVCFADQASKVAAVSHTTLSLWDAASAHRIAAYRSPPSDDAAPFSCVQEMPLSNALVVGGNQATLRYHQSLCTHYNAFVFSPVALHPLYIHQSFCTLFNVPSIFSVALLPLFIPLTSMV